MATQLVAEAIIRAVDQFSGPVGKMAQSLDRLTGGGGVLQAVGARTRSLGKTFLAAGTVITTGIALPLGKAVNIYGDFEEQLISLKRVWPGTEAQFDAFARTIGRIATEVPITQGAIAAIAEEAVRAKTGLSESGLFDPSDLEQFVILASKYVDVFNGISPDKSVELLLNIKKQLGLTVAETALYADQMALLDSKLRATGEELLVFSARVADLTQNVGGGKKAAFQITALGGAMLDLGVDAKKAAEASNELLRALSLGAGASDGTKRAMILLGFDPASFANMMAADMGLALNKLFEALQRQGGDNQLSLLEMIGGKNLREALAPVLSDLDSFQKKLALITDPNLVAGALDREFTQNLEGINRQIRLLNNSLGDIAKEALEQFLPLAKEVVVTLKEWMIALRDMPAVRDILGKTLIGLAVAGPILLGVGSALLLIAESSKIVYSTLSGGMALLTAVGLKWALVGAALVAATLAFMKLRRLISGETSDENGGTGLDLIFGTPEQFEERLGQYTGKVDDWVQQQINKGAELAQLPKLEPLSAANNWGLGDGTETGNLAFQITAEKERQRILVEKALAYEEMINSRSSDAGTSAVALSQKLADQIAAQRERLRMLAEQSGVFDKMTVVQPGSPGPATSTAAEPVATQVAAQIKRWFGAPEEAMLPSGNISAFTAEVDAATAALAQYRAAEDANAQMVREGMAQIQSRIDQLTQETALIRAWSLRQQLMAKDLHDQSMQAEKEKWDAFQAMMNSGGSREALEDATARYELVKKAQREFDIQAPKPPGWTPNAGGPQDMSNAPLARESSNLKVDITGKVDSYVEGVVSGKIENEIVIRVEGTGGKVVRQSSSGGEVSGELKTGRSMPDTE